MEQVIDVSWMNHGKESCQPNPQADNAHEIDKLSKHNNTKQVSSSPPNHDSANGHILESASASKINGKTAPISPPPSPPPAATPPSAKQIPQRPGVARSGSADEKKSPGPNGTPPQRRGSWFSKISSPFSSTPSAAQQSSPAAPSQSDADDDVAPLPKINPNKNAVLPHATRQPGDGPYVPAPPRNGQPGFFQVFRRKSSSNGSILQGRGNHGLVERRVLNVDKQRERPRLSELNQAKLRRVAFCVDVEIAPMPKYSDSETSGNMGEEKTQKRKITEKGEGEALKRPKAVEEEKESNGVIKATGEQLPKEPEKEGTNTEAASKEESKTGITVSTEEPKPEKENTRKKEKKKKSEAERKAKKEQKRKEALEKGAIPMEIHLDSDSSTEDVAVPQIPRPSKYTPTTNPGRIYRRCCQLRETDILTKITSQLPKTTATNPDGVVEKLDLTDYFLSLPDMVTLGDFFAVVPVKEVVLENCGLTDEGIRVVLAGLLASKKQKAKQRKSITRPADLCHQGGVVERLVLKNNKLGVDGWKHICLFIHMCRSLKCLDLSSIAFPAPSEPVKTTPLSHHFPLHAAPVTQLDISLLLSKALGERLAGAELELLSLGETGLTTAQLGAVIDGCLKSGISRLGLAHNDIDAQGIEHVARYLRGGKCQGLDLGGNDLRDHLQTIADAISEDNETLWALSLANGNVNPSSLCKLLPKLAQIKNCKFIDLSHNHELCESQPSAIGLLRRYLPKLDSLKRLHLADIAMTSEQAIAVAEILPEVSTLAHINLLENPELVRLADAKTEEAQEEACALYASLLAAARVSQTLVKIDIDTPSAGSSEIVIALANQVLAYCLRNLRMAPDIRDSAGGQGPEKMKYPDVLRHIVGHEEDTTVVELDDVDVNAAPDEDYVIGGTGVVKALTCCLNNLDQNVRRDSGEFIRDLETGAVVPTAKVHGGKAKDMSKHLLASARKIRARLQPILAQAKASSREDMNNYSKRLAVVTSQSQANAELDRLLFLDQTLQEIIRRFEDEFPETRQQPGPLMAPNYLPPAPPQRGGSFSSAEVDPVFTDNEDLETDLLSPFRSRSNSIMSHTSKQLAVEEGRALRIGHHFRRGFIQAHYNLLTGAESEIGHDPDHKKMIEHMLEDLGADSEDIRKKVEAKGAIATFQEERNEILRRMRDKDPVQWDRFIEAQEKTRANIQLGNKEEHPKSNTLADESAIAD
ncbi:cell wall biogenesis protein Mhp1 [Seiridium cupressi]